MCYVYILRSRKDGQLYIGSTRDLRRRLREHNSGIVPSTKHRGPFDLVYYEAYRSETDARHRESNVKLRSKAFTQLRKRLRGSLMFGVGL